MGFPDVRHLILAALLCILALPVAAHELGMAQVEATFLRDGTFIVDLKVDREHVPPGTSLAHIAQSAVLSFDGQRVSSSSPEITDGAIARIRLRADPACFYRAPGPVRPEAHPLEGDLNHES